jgi:polyphosphate glucokinase
VDVFGLDIGGSGIKGAPVDLKTGALLEERIRIPTPRPPPRGAGADVA